MEKQGMTFEERTKLVEEADGTVSTGAVNDDNIFNPLPVEVKLGDRIYKMLPLKLKQMRSLIRLSKVNLNAFGEEQLETVIDCISEILNEPDKGFLEDNLDVPTMVSLFAQIQKANYGDVPKPKASDKAKAGN